MLEAFKKNSGLYIKLGQLIATVDSQVTKLEILAPNEYVQTFSEMYQNAPTSDYSTVKKMVEDAIGMRIEEAFSS